MVEKVPDSTYENVGGLDKQIKEIKEVIELPVKHPELFDALGIAQPKVSENLLTFNSSFVIVALLNILSVDYLLRWSKGYFETEFCLHFAFNKLDFSVAFRHSVFTVSSTSCLFCLSRVFCCTVHLELAKHFWPVLSLTIPSAHLFESLGLNSFRSSSVKDHGWSANCSLWPGTFS